MEDLNKEPLNVLVGRLRHAIKMKGMSRQLELLEVLSERIIGFGVLHPDIIEFVGPGENI